MSNCFLIDTCALLWANADSQELSEKVEKVIGEPNNRILVSQATIWELSIKLTVGKIKLPEEFFERLPELGYETLEMKDTHFAAYRRLPLLHRDPFDRMLVAQSICEHIPLLTPDSAIARYEVECIW